MVTNFDTNCCDVASGFDDAARVVRKPRKTLGQLTPIYREKDVLRHRSHSTLMSVLVYFSHIGLRPLSWVAQHREVIAGFVLAALRCVYPASCLFNVYLMVPAMITGWFLDGRNYHVQWLRKQKDKFRVTSIWLIVGRHSCWSAKTFKYKNLRLSAWPDCCEIAGTSIRLTGHRCHHTNTQQLWKRT